MLGCWDVEWGAEEKVQDSSAIWRENLEAEKSRMEPAWGREQTMLIKKRMDPALSAAFFLPRPNARDVPCSDRQLERGLQRFLLKGTWPRAQPWQLGTN